jgi:formate hydrogenlyase subunit 6/NADH:ubiquinone oxidoreductase subunit I
MRVARRRFLTGRFAPHAADSILDHFGASPLRPAILKGCVARQGVACRSCADACDQQAMRFELKPGGIALPRARFEACTGCGICADVCPVQSIAMYLPDGTAAI